MAITKRIRKTGITVYSIDFYDQSGRRVREQAGTTPTQARKLLRSRLGQVMDGTYRNPRDESDTPDAGTTFRQFADRFMREYGDLRRSSYYAQQVKVLVAHFGDRPLCELTAADLDGFRLARGRAAGPSTVRKDLTILGKMFKLAVRWGVVPASPAVGMDKPSEPQHKTRYLSSDEWGRLLEAAPPWLRPIVTFAVASGMRLKEIAGLRWDGVDRAAGFIHLSADNKTERPRILPIGAAIAAVLDERAKVVDLRTGGSLSPWVFCDDAGAPFDTREGRDRIGKTTKATMRLARIEGASFHTLRHTTGTRLAEQGHSESEIAAYLGHASTQTTRRYIHLRPAHLRAAAGSLDAFLSHGHPDGHLPVSTERGERVNVPQLQQLGR